MSTDPAILAERARDALAAAAEATRELHDSQGSLVMRASLASDVVKIERLLERADQRVVGDDAAEDLDL